MEFEELRNRLVDVTSIIWREAAPDSRGFVFDWIHPDVAPEHAIDGVQLTWQRGADYVGVWTEDKELMFTQKLDELDARLSIAIEYAQMAGGLLREFPDLTNIPTITACQMAVEGIYLSGDYSPAFYSSADGVGWWYGDGYACEYDSAKQAFVIWHGGSYWIAATPEGYVKALEKAAIDVERMAFEKLKNELQ